MPVMRNARMAWPRKGPGTVATGERSEPVDADVFHGDCPEGAEEAAHSLRPFGAARGNRHIPRVRCAHPWLQTGAPPGLDQVLETIGKN